MRVLITGNDTYNAKKSETPESIEFKKAQIENTRLSSVLIALQIKEAKTKRKFAILGAIGGGIITLVSTHVKEIWTAIQHFFSS